jgi:hypothetical protein
MRIEWQGPKGNRKIQNEPAKEENLSRDFIVVFREHSSSLKAYIHRFEKGEALHFSSEEKDEFLKKLRDLKDKQRLKVLQDLLPKSMEGVFSYRDSIIMLAEHETRTNYYHSLLRKDLLKFIHEDGLSKSKIFYNFFRLFFGMSFVFFGLTIDKYMSSSENEINSLRQLDLFSCENDNIDLLMLYSITSTVCALFAIYFFGKSWAMDNNVLNHIFEEAKKYQKLSHED